MGDTGTKDTILRFALGMRGGVSLAVWIGGAAAELDDLRCATAEADGYHRRMLALGGYSHCEIDVMSGASAGGLNAVLAAAAMVGRRRVSEMRTTWLRVAGLRSLLEASGDGDGDRRSLLGGEYFESSIRREVTRLMRPPANPTAPPLDHRLEVFLSATVHGGVHVPIEDDDYSRDTARRSGALFHFRHFASDARTSDLSRPDVIDHLSRAARTTASFPTAFEPVRFRPGDMMPGQLLLPAVPQGPLWLLDGGIVDNIPVARAIEGVPAVPAQTATDRWLIYLQPSPDAVGSSSTVSATSTGAATDAGGSDPVPAPAPGATAPTLFGVARGLLGAFMSESILDDVEVLRRHNLDAIAAGRAWNAAVAEADAADAGAVTGSAARAFEGARLVALLLDPQRELVWRPIGTQLPVSPLGAATSSQLSRFRDLVDDAAAARPGTLRPFASIVRTAAVLIHWAKSVERAVAGASKPAAEGAGAVKQACYQVMQLAQLLTTAIDADTLAASGRSMDAEAIVIATDASARALTSDPALQRLVDALPLPSRELAASVRLSPLLQRLYEGTYHPEQSQPDIDVDGRLWRLLGAQAAALAPLPLPASPPAGDLDFTAIRASVLAGLLPDDDEAGAHHAECVLRWIDQRTIAVHRGAAEALPAKLKYLRIAGSNVSPLCLSRAEFPYDGPRFESSALVRPGGAVAPKLKLAGSDLANFSAFVSQRWRANDWMWGRLDAAKSMVDVITAPGRLEAGSGGDLASLIADVRAIVTAPFAVQAPAPPAWNEELHRAATALWARYETIIEGELAGQATSIAANRLTVTKRVLVLRRHWEILAQELPAVLAADLLPLEEAGTAAASSADVAPVHVPALVATAIGSYETSPRSFGAVWGRRWSTALGIRAAYETWAATRPKGTLARVLRAPLKPLPMSVFGTVLARNRGLLALSIGFNLIVVPRLRGSGGWVLFAVAALVGALMAKAYAARPGADRPLPFERHGRLLQLAALAMFVVGAGVLAVGRLRSWMLRVPDRTDLTRFSSDLVTPYVVIATVAGGIATMLLWNWARWRWRLLASVLVAAIGGFWALFSQLRRGADAAWWARALFGFGSMFWAGVLAVTLTTTIAHFAFRQGWRILQYDHD